LRIPSPGKPQKKGKGKKASKGKKSKKKRAESPLFSSQDYQVNLNKVVNGDENYDTDSASNMPDLIVNDTPIQPYKTPSHEGPDKFRKPDFEKKTAELQSQFEKLLNETHKSSTDDFYKIMSEFYGKDLRHKSPTTRLVAQKNSTSEHKEVMARGLVRT
jgi:hypothetical protein